ncbi:MAG: DUF4352 domain-containing protein [Nanoarchaeota archaeon]
MNSKYFVIIFLGLAFVFLSACSSQTVYKFQCSDGTFVDTASKCSLANVAELSNEPINCSACPVKTETKVETNTVTEKIYVCSDMREVKTANDCKSTEQKAIESSSDNLVLTINSARTARAIGDYSMETLKSDEQYVIVDFTIYNKELEDGYEFNPNWVLLEDSKGYSYSYSWNSPNLPKYWGGMAGVTVEYQQKKSGELAFVVPKTEKKFTLIVKDFTGVNGKKTFTLT